MSKFRKYKKKPPGRKPRSFLSFFKKELRITCSRSRLEEIREEIDKVINSASYKSHERFSDLGHHEIDNMDDLESASRKMEEILKNK